LGFLPTQREGVCFPWKENGGGRCSPPPPPFLTSVLDGFQSQTSGFGRLFAWKVSPCELNSVLGGLQNWSGDLEREEISGLY